MGCCVCAEGEEGCGNEQSWMVSLAFLNLSLLSAYLLIN